MQASDVMTAGSVTIAPEASVAEAARAMLNHRVSALPVVDGEDRLVGIVSERDLIHRVETHTERRPQRWSTLFTADAERAADYVKSHGRRVAEVMTRAVITVEPLTPLAEIADLFDAKRIKRVPVIADGRLVGIVSRADLLRVLASGAAATHESSARDQTIRGALIGELAGAAWTRAQPADIVVADGVVHLWGVVASEDERQALRIAAENIPGVRGVEDHMTLRRLYPLV